MYCTFIKGGKASSAPNKNYNPGKNTDREKGTGMVYIRIVEDKLSLLLIVSTTFSDFKTLGFSMHYNFSEFLSHNKHA